MGEELEIYEGNAPTLTVQEIKAGVQIIQQVLESVMIDGTHFGKVPGCGPKPALLKPGAEKILSTFRIAVDPIVEDLSTSDEARYRVTARGISQQTGAFLGAGIGEASTDEEKFKWQAAVCPEEYDATMDDRRRIKFKRSGADIIQVKQIRSPVADKANTVLKMAKKRALVDLTLTVTAASDIFAQDLDDTPAGGQELQKPARKSGAAAPGPTADADGHAPGNVVIGLTGDVSVKTGKNKSGEWKKYSVQLDGEWYSTFSETEGAKLQEAAASGVPVTIGYSFDKSGKYRNIEEITLMSSENDERPDDPVTPVGPMADPNAEAEPPWPESPGQ